MKFGKLPDITRSDGNMLSTPEIIASGKKVFQKYRSIVKYAKPCFKYGS